MRFLRHLLLALVALAPLPAYAQTAQDQGIVVEGQRGSRATPGNPMSEWRVFETAHVLVYGRGDEKKLFRIAHNLERLHFLLSMLLNRVDQEDNTVKIRVTISGDMADFDQLDLTNVRWQSGPYPPQFQTQLYYDPREEGPVLATTHTDQRIELARGVDIRTLDFAQPKTNATAADFNPAGASGGEKIMVGEVAFQVTADSRLYAGFAQHFLMTYFPAAYPRWYLEGFGEIFGTVSADFDGVIEYGRAPEGFREVSQWSGAYPVRGILDGSYLNPRSGGRPKWTPFRAWALTHLLFFNEQWKQPLHNYLAAVARGASTDEAIAAFGDLDKLQSQLSFYKGANIPFERLTYPPDRAAPPLVRQLTRSEANYVRGKLVMGARLEIPAAPGPERDRAIKRRDKWLADLRIDVARFPLDLEYQLLLAEAECRSGNSAECLAVAERVLAKAPNRPEALLWKGVALAQQANAGPASQRKGRLRIARGFIVRANKADTEAVMPLLAYYRSFDGDPAPDAAVLGLVKANEVVPSAPTTRLMLGEELAKRGDAEGARRMLLPVAAGAYDSPEKARAQEILNGLPR
jgi:hypothetical protein